MLPQVPTVDATAVADDAVLLDVREPTEWVVGHAPGAVHVPMSELPGRLDDVPRHAGLVVACRVGGRSAQVAAWLNAGGWSCVNLDGGMLAWARAGKPMVSENGQPPAVR